MDGSGPPTESPGEYRVEELARRASVSVDTVRYYQTRGLLPAPRRRGRVALYGDAHLERLARIRALHEEGLTLALIAKVLEAPEESPTGPLLEALAREHVGERTLSREELAREAGLPAALVSAAQQAGLLEPLHLEGEERFAASDVEMARAGLAVLQAGFPMAELLQLAVDHARNVRDVTERAIDLFDDNVRKTALEDAEGAASVTAAFHDLLPQVTRLIALHFQRTLVTRALERLDRSGASDDLRAALSATRDRSLAIEVGWRGAGGGRRP
ncbi:MAG: MerR family transcriptional regulator [Myxococcota bacterium]|nr:MerR family transcriptional regulator [Myxococcota bacterium]